MCDSCFSVVSRKDQTCDLLVRNSTSGEGGRLFVILGSPTGGEVPWRDQYEYSLCASEFEHSSMKKKEIQKKTDDIDEQLKNLAL